MTLSNAKHELFAQALSVGLTQDAAYERAGYKPDRANANKLTANHHVIARVREIQAAAAVRNEITVDDILAELNENRNLSVAKDQMAAANAATMGKAKVLGMLIDQVKDVTDIEAMSEDELAAEDARLAEEIAELEKQANQGPPPGEAPTQH